MQNHKKIKLIVKVSLSHLIVIFSLFCIIKLQSCHQNVREYVTQVKLVSYPAPQKSASNSNVPVKTAIRKAHKSVKKVMTYRSPEAIRASGFMKLEKAKTVNNVKSRKKQVKKIDITSIQQDLNMNLDVNDLNHIGSDLKTIENDYQKYIIDLLYKSWDQPSRSEVGNDNPIVEIIIKIQRNGSITEKKIISPSQIPAMDTSIEKLLDAIIKFPPFPDTMNKDSITKNIVLELT